MASSRATTVAAYLAELPPERRKEIAAARALVRKHLPKGYQEAMGYGMITWAVPLSAYPHTRDKQPLCYAALAAQKNFNTLYLMVSDAENASYEWLAGEFEKAGKKFDMGKSCLHFKRFDDLVPEAIGRVVASQRPAEFIASHEAARATKKAPR